jgi:hypothetical protein
MNITAAINIPCVSQTNLWKGCFEAHFMSGREIDVKYPILNTKWKYSHHKLRDVYDDYDGYYYAYEKDIGTGIMFDPWLREFKVNMSIADDVYKTKMYHTTVESNAVLLVLYKKKYV